MANSSAIWQQAAHTTYQLSSPSCCQSANQNDNKNKTNNKTERKPHLTRNKKCLSFLERDTERERERERKKSGEWTISSKMIRQKNQED